MPTNLGPNGQYPIWDIWERDAPSFETLWKEHFSFAPEVPLDWREAEKFKSFAKRIYGLVDLDGFVQKVADTAYEDGENDGYLEGEETVKQKVKKYLDDLT